MGNDPRATSLGKNHYRIHRRLDVGLRESALASILLRAFTQKDISGEISDKN